MESERFHHTLVSKHIISYLVVGEDISPKCDAMSVNKCLIIATVFKIDQYNKI